MYSIYVSELVIFQSLCISAWPPSAVNQSAQWLFLLSGTSFSCWRFEHRHHFAVKIIPLHATLSPSLKVDQTLLSRGSWCLNMFPVSCQSSVCRSIAPSPDTSSNKNRGDHLVRLPFVVSSKGSKVSQSCCMSLSSFDVSCIGQYSCEKTSLAAFQTDLIIFYCLFHLVTLAGLCFSLYQQFLLIYSELSKTWTFFIDESQSYHL